MSPEAGPPREEPLPDPLSDPLTRLAAEYDRERLAEEKRTERYVWWYLAYFLFGIHVIAFVMIFAIKHAG